jgi:hypothetical protein
MPDESKLREHLAVLRKHERALDRDDRVQLPDREFRIIADDIVACTRDLPGVLPPFAAGQFSSGRIEGSIVELFHLGALRTYLASAVAKLEARRQPASPKKADTNRGFISHVPGDYALADYLRRALEAGAPGVTYFMSSERGHINSGVAWCEKIFEELKQADRFLILLTPASIERLWVSFETGAAWMTEWPCVLLAAGLQAPVPQPLSMLQVLFLDGPRPRDAVVQAFEQLGSEPPADLHRFLARVPHLVQAGAEQEAGNAGWHGVPLGHDFYAWDGPLNRLADYEPVDMPLELDAELAEQEKLVRFRRPSSVCHRPTDLQARHHQRQRACARCPSVEVRKNRVKRMGSRERRPRLLRPRHA